MTTRPIHARKTTRRTSPENGRMSIVNNKRHTISERITRPWGSAPNRQLIYCVQSSVARQPTAAETPPASADGRRVAATTSTWRVARRRRQRQDDDATVSRSADNFHLIYLSICARTFDKSSTLAAISVCFTLRTPHGIIADDELQTFGGGEHASEC